ncbi:hypothetical protein PENTCL1PPCAC_9855, partial [Pristionchus entomophagus]
LQNQVTMSTATEATIKAGLTVDEKVCQATAAHEDPKVVFERQANAAGDAAQGGLTEGATATGVTSKTVAGMAHGLADGAKGVASKAGHVVSDTAHTAKEGVCRAARRMSDTAHSAYEKTKDALGKAN